MNRPHDGDNLDVLRRHGEDTWEWNEDAIAPRLCGRKQSSDAIMPAMTGDEPQSQAHPRRQTCGIIAERFSTRRLLASSSSTSSSRNSRCASGAASACAARAGRASTMPDKRMITTSKPSPVLLTSQKFNQYLAEEGLRPLPRCGLQKGRPTLTRARTVRALRKATPARGSGRPVSDRPAPRAAAGACRREEPLPSQSWRDPAGSHPLQESASRRRARDGAQPAPPNCQGRRTVRQAGRVQLRLSQPGPWLIKAVHMIPATGAADRQWDSFWASLTCEVPEARAALRCTRTDVLVAACQLFHTSATISPRASGPA